MINKIKNHITIHLFFLICTIGLFNGCSKKEIEPVNPSTSNLTTDKTQYASYEIVTLKIHDNDFSGQTITGKINGIETVIESGDSLAFFIVPSLFDGDYSISFTANGRGFNVPIKVASLTTISSPEVYFTEMETAIHQKIQLANTQISELEQIDNSLNEYGDLTNDVLTYSDLLADYRIQYNNLSNEEKEEFAKCMAANKAKLAELNSLYSSFSSSTVNLRTMQTVRNYETEVVTSSNNFKNSVVFTAAHIPYILLSAKIAASIPNVYVKAGAILALGVTVCSFMLSADQTITLSEALIYKALKPYDNLSVSETIYAAGEEISVNITANYRSIISGDENDGTLRLSNGGNTISNIGKTYNYFKDEYNGLINKLPSFLKPSYTLKNLKSAFNSTSRFVYNDYIKISNVSNPTVLLKQLNQPDGSIKIKATTTATTDQNFTYDIEYSNSNFTKSFKKTIAGKVVLQTCSPSMIFGTWIIQDYLVDNSNPNGFVKSDHFITMTIPPTPANNGCVDYGAVSEATLVYSLNNYSSAYCCYFTNCALSVSDYYFYYTPGVSVFTTNRTNSLEGTIHHSVFTKQ